MSIRAGVRHVGGGTVVFRNALPAALLCLPCFVENDRREIERKIHQWHHERGDPTANDDPYAHPGIACIGCCCGIATPIMHAQNYLVMKKFQETQAAYLGADAPVLHA